MVWSSSKRLFVKCVGVGRETEKTNPIHAQW